MQILEKTIHQIDNIINCNYKDKNGKKLKILKLISRYDLCDKSYLNYIKSYMNITTHKPKILENITIIDISSGTAILALSFLNAIYNKNTKYKLILNDILFANRDDQNIQIVLEILEDLENKIENISIEIRDKDILKNDLKDLESLDSFILIADPSISTNNANSFKTLEQFFSNEIVDFLFKKASYILFKDSINIKSKYKELFKYKRYDQLEEGLNINLISKIKITILSIFNKNINKNIKSISNYCQEKLAKIYFFYDTTKLHEGEMSNFYYNGYTLDNSSVEYQILEEENNRMLKSYENISLEEVINKYEDLKGKL